MHGIFKRDYEPYQTMGPLATLNWTAGKNFLHGISMPPPTSSGTKCTKASMKCSGNILGDDIFS